MQNTKPLVSVATVCERILVEKDNVFSVIRIVDVFWIAPEIISSQPGGALPISCLVALKAGNYTGQGELSLVIEAPDGKRLEAPENRWPLFFDKDRSGANLIFNMALAFRHIGVNWIEIFWNGEFLTKFAVTLVVGVRPEQEAPSSQ
jgi:hypothetical protein